MKPTVDNGMSDPESFKFYSSKPRLIHIAINITIAPILLYLLGAWAWPPTLPHYIVFAITGLIALRYTRQRWNTPRLILDDSGLHCGEFYPAETIHKAEASIRALKLTVLKDANVKEKIVSLGWASGEDIKTITQVVTARFPDKT